MFKFHCLVFTLTLLLSSPSLAFLRCPTGICPLLSKYFQHSLITAITFAGLINCSLGSSSNIPGSSATHLQEFSFCLPSFFLDFLQYILFLLSYSSFFPHLSHSTILFLLFKYFQCHFNYFTIRGGRKLAHIHSSNCLTTFVSL